MTSTTYDHLYQAIENGIADLSDPALKDRVASLVEGAGSTVTPGTLRRCARRRGASFETRTERRRDHLRALAQRVDVVDGQEIGIAGSKRAVAASAETAAIGVRSFIPEWRAVMDENEYYSFAVTL
ncbi:hypothetical protein E9232_005653 [Inquilinus ginsengisoli]|uniref:KfrA N-terminal DNA-binding domain-containing protein n=1 Tax=Inquilinus ginsengisoli TaxID=363840 RepID=A0ABU1JWW4_9PROT|nr:hypothetical protein [Inquilinus ginsengisoli]MDR6293103.1 hypothetical protein [Inquilinus ginsengisoli]